jgi:hypothetical protein
MKIKDKITCTIELSEEEAKDFVSEKEYIASNQFDPIIISSISDILQDKLNDKGAYEE